MSKSACSFVVVLALLFGGCASSNNLSSDATSLNCVESDANPEVLKCSMTRIYSAGDKQDAWHKASLAAYKACGEKDSVEFTADSLAPKWTLFRGWHFDNVKCISSELEQG